MKKIPLLFFFSCFVRGPHQEHLSLCTLEKGLILFTTALRMAPLSSYRSKREDNDLEILERARSCERMGENNK